VQFAQAYVCKITYIKDYSLWIVCNKNYCTKQLSLSICHLSRKTEINGRGNPLRWPRDILYPQKIWSNFADKRLSLGRYSSLAD
jgi:hypothetical protein